jgi:hypothetical protein
MSVKARFDVEVLDWRVAQETVQKVRAGSWFLFGDRVAPASGRLARLLARPTRERSVLALSGGPIDLPGLRLTPRPRAIHPLACLVADRDLYRAGQDTVNLFCAVPGQAEAYGKSGLSIALSCNGALLTRRDLDLGKEGIAVETFAALLSGRYRARLMGDGAQVGPEATFTVAEYTLAPLTGRLGAHRIDRGAAVLHFELEVESYQVPFDRELDVALVEDGREVARTRIAARAAGLYGGSLPIAGGEGPFRLRLTAAGDASRIAEVAIPGSRKEERETTVVSELGREMLFSSMPEAGALPIRGGYLTQGDFLATPITVDRIDTAEGTLRAQAALEALVLVAVDLATGKETVIEKGDVPAGSEIAVPPSAVCSVFAGAWVAGQPFEGFTTFFRPSALRVQVSVPASVRPREEIAIRLSCASAPGKSVPVLLCVRDQRLTAADTPEAALASSAKKAVEAATAGMRDAGLTSLATLVQPPRPAMPPMDDGPWFSGTAVSRSSPPPPAATRATASAPRPSASPRGRGSAGEPDTDSSIMGRAASFFGLAAAPGASVEEEPVGVMLRQETAATIAAPLTGARKATPPPARAEFPEVLFYGLVPVSGEETVRIPAGDALGSFAVEVFALAGGDWAQERASFVVDRPVRADLDLPATVYEADKVTGRLRASAASGRAVVRLTRDGAAVALAGGSEAAMATPVELAFDVRPGRYVATVEDAATGERDVVEIHVGTPGKFRSLVREVGLLQKGDALTLDSAGALSLRILPGLDTPFKQLVDATADYGHLCCEQTAAKILAAVVMWLTSEGPAGRKKAESVILAGVAREKTMWKRGVGFAMYPESDGVNTHWGGLAAQHLWSLVSLEDVPGASKALAEAVRDGLAMADDVGKALKLRRVPERVASMADAFATARGPDSGRRNARAWMAAEIDLSGASPRLRNGRDRVSERAALCHGAAALLALGDVADGVRVANVVTRQLNEQGRLYSTVDSTAAIALFGELQRAGIVGGAGRVKVNGREMTCVEAARLSDQVETIEVLSGVVPVEVSRIHEEDWSRFSADLPLRIGFRDEAGAKTGRFRMGDRVDLQVELPKGYKAGDIVHVALPAALSWIEGGGKVKRFTRDFEGKSSLAVPLVVTGEIEGKQHFAVCVRNMFEEERAASPGMLSVGA